jgi:DNA adenine methylase
MLVSQTDSHSPVQPFLKWAGGKRWLAPALADLFGSADGRHVEPFAGSAAFFFASNAREAVLADINKELINCFCVVRDNVSELINRLKRLSVDADTFCQQRRAQLRSDVSRAARFIYLNRAAFNGLYRVNKNGRFNVPFGCKPNTQLCDAEGLFRCSDRLSGTVLTVADFEATLSSVSDSDRVFVDPPYTVKHNMNAFRRYNEKLFSWDDQIRLAGVMHRLANDAGRIILTNANHQDVRRLYSPQCFFAFAISRATNMAAITEKRGMSEELLIVSRAAGVSARKLRTVLTSHFPGRVDSVRLLGGQSIG